jgi:DNA end-binding protein Ku
MPRRKKTATSEEQRDDLAAETGARPSRAIWKGAISFGLVNIPVSLHSAESRDDISFHLLDKRNLSPVRYQRINENTGKEVPWAEIVKGYEYGPGEYVVISDEDLRRANAEATQTVEITEFVDESDITTVYFDKPYYLEPGKKAHKSYALLREVLARSGKVGIARLVLRSREYIAAVYPLGRVLVANLLRYAHELRDPAALDLPSENLKENGIAEGEVKMAERLVEAMVGKWDPRKFKDEYRTDLMKLIESRIESGKTTTVDETPVPEPRRTGKVVDIMELLKKSIEQADKNDSRTKRRTDGRRKAG